MVICTSQGLLAVVLVVTVTDDLTYENLISVHNK